MKYKEKITIGAREGKSKRVRRINGVGSTRREDITILVIHVTGSFGFGVAPKPPIVYQELPIFGPLALMQGLELDCPRCAKANAATL